MVDVSPVITVGTANLLAAIKRLQATFLYSAIFELQTEMAKDVFRPYRKSTLASGVVAARPVAIWRTNSPF